MPMCAEHRSTFEALHHQVTCPYEWKIPDWDEKPQTNKQTNKQVTSSIADLFKSLFDLDINC